MKFSTIAAAFAAFGVALAAPTKRQSTDIDAVVLQFALTLEHLENAFYKNALSRWSIDEFTAAGFTPMFYDELKYIAHDEESHVTFLEAGLTAAGATPNAACVYDFPMTTPKEFITLASVIEGVGVSAYLGAAPLITEKAYLTAAGAILVTEALHQSAQRGAIGEIPMANPYGTPMGPNAVYSIASAFIKSCPASNSALPFMAYPGLTVNSGSPTATGAFVDLMPAGALPATYYATFVSGLNIVPVTPGMFANGMTMVQVPPMIEGQSYVFITADNSGNLTDANILFGPAILEVTPSSPTFDLSITK